MVKSSLISTDLMNEYSFELHPRRNTRVKQGAKSIDISSTILSVQDVYILLTNLPLTSQALRKRIAACCPNMT